MHQIMMHRQHSHHVKSLSSIAIEKMQRMVRDRWQETWQAMEARMQIESTDFED